MNANNYTANVKLESRAEAVKVKQSLNNTTLNGLKINVRKSSNIMYHSFRSLGAVDLGLVIRFNITRVYA